MTFKKSLTDLAEVIVKRAKEKDTPFSEAVEAVKALTALYGTLLKDKGKSEDESDGFTMADAQATIEDNGQHGEAEFRGRRGRSGSHSSN